MNIHELKTAPVERVEGAKSEDVAGIISRARRPIIFSGLDRDFEFLRKWNLDFFAKYSEMVPVQKPEADGVNYFVKYFQMSLAVPSGFLGNSFCRTALNVLNCRVLGAANFEKSRNIVCVFVWFVCLFV